MATNPDHTAPEQPPRSWGRANARWLLPVAVVGAAVLAWLAFGFFGVHTLFFDDEVSEAQPVFDSGAGASGLQSDAISPDLAEEMNEAATELDMPTEVDIAEPTPEMTEPAVVSLAEGSFVDRSHPTEGQANVLNDGTDQRFLRLDDFRTDNGPDLNVYLTRADADADTAAFGREGDYVDLGDLKGNVGPQNYEIPIDLDLAEFDTVVIWCVRFGVAFGAADLTAV